MKIFTDFGKCFGKRLFGKFGKVRKNKIGKTLGKILGKFWEVFGKFLGSF
jgi:hypothetical protein